MLERLADLAAEHAQLERDLADPAVHADQEKARALGRRYSELTPIVQAYSQWRQVSDDQAAAIELAGEDPSFALEADQFAIRKYELEQRLEQLLVPRDALDAKDVILEIKAGEGGEESALFAADLLRMYLRYAERQGWKAEILDATGTGLGGYKDVTVAVKAAGRGSLAGTPHGAWSMLKYEGGVHRVQRVPVTEGQGRKHTSAATVAVLPEAEEVDVKIEDKDLRIDVFRSQGPGGQSVNTTDSAVRITHLPTNLVVQCQDQKSQLQNKIRALEVLRSRLLDKVIAEQEAARARERRAQVGTGDRSQKIRTYNFPQNRVTDHRIHYTVHNLSEVLDGNLDDLINALRVAGEKERLSA